MNHDDALAVIQPPIRKVSFRGEEIAVVPLRVRQVPDMVRAARPVLAALLAQDIGLTPESPLEAVAAVLLDLVEKEGEGVIAAIAIAVDRDPAWVGDAPVVEALDLGLQVFEVNRDFFLHRLVPLLRVRAQPTSGAGPTSSSC